MSKPFRGVTYKTKASWAVGALETFIGPKPSCHLGGSQQLKLVLIFTMFALRSPVVWELLPGTLPASLLAIASASAAYEQRRQLLEQHACFPEP